jgi:iron(III) transport system ATP-binding protein
MARVRIEGLQKSYGSYRALRDVDLDIPSGTFFTLLGPSGCGKTTLLRAIAGFHFQDAGEIRLDDVALGQMHASRREVGMVFQDYAIFPHLSVWDNVCFGLVQRKLPRQEMHERAIAVLETVQLVDQRDRMPAQLSGGQQQRVGLARALVIRPKVLLMDEPLSNLDAQLRIELRQDIRRTQRRLGITTIYVTHDQEEALSVSDLICVMNQGSVQQVGTPWEIYRQPVNRFVASFVGAHHFSELAVSAGGTVRWLGGDWAAPASAGPGQRVVLAVRPEKLRVARAPIEDLPGCGAAIETATFTGREIQLQLRTDEGLAVDAIVSAHSDATEWRAGDRACVHARPEDLMWFAAGAGGERLT